MKIRNVTIAGGGTLGSQIAWQTAYHGFQVTVYDSFEKGLESSKLFHKHFAALFLATRGATQDKINETNSRLTYTTNLAEAVKDADIISESIPEDAEIKKSFYRELSKIAPEKTIFTTNTSTTLPSDYAIETGRPHMFLALHFANGIWDANIGEVMGHPDTDPEVFSRVVEFAKEIGMVPIPIHKEQNGYIINTLLSPLLSAAMNLYTNEIADFESIDKTWMICTGVKHGPFALMDIIGMNTIYNVTKLWADRTGDKTMIDRAQLIQENFIDKNKLGVSSGEGFYKYPNPSFEDPEFLK